MRRRESRAWLSLAVLLAAVGPGASAQQVRISFEEAEGFPAAGGKFTGPARKRGVATAWTNDSVSPNYWATDDGPGGAFYPEAPTPISGKQVAVFGSGGPGITVGTLHLAKKGGYRLTSFYWAYRGNGNSRVGGNAWLEVECFDAFRKSLGVERFYGGLGDKMLPKFELAKMPAQAAPVASVVFRGVPPDIDKWHGTFFLEDLTLTSNPTDYLTLIKDGQAACTIVAPAGGDKWTEQAVVWLREYVHKATGVRLNVVADGKRPPEGTLISVGRTTMAVKAGIDDSGLKSDGCKVIVKGKVVYLLGRDSKRIIPTHPLAGAKGTCRAVLMFLEDFCGIRWLLPGEQGEYIPRSRDIEIPKDFAKTFDPAFAYSTGRFPYDYGYLVDGGGTPGAIINNYRCGVLATPGGHTYYHAVPTDKYFKEHPEYFALINGKRTGAGNHLCTSNPVVRKLLLEWTRERLDEGWEWFTIGQEDGYIRCECAECEALDDYRWAPTGARWEDFQNDGLRDTPCERLFLTHKWVIDQVAKSHPDKKVMLMCYAPTAWPSKKIDYFGNNVICEVMEQSPAYLDAWKGKSAGMACYFYLFTNQCPMGFNVSVTAREIAEKVRYLHGYGMTGIYHGAESNWGLMGPTLYVFGKMMGDPSLDYRALVKEYCDGAFGHASRPMRHFFALLDRRLEQVLPLATEDFSGRNTTLPRWIKTPDMFLMQYPPSFLNRLEGLLQQAEAAAGTERTRGWVKLSREHFDFVKLLTHALIAHRAWQINPTSATWEALGKHVDAFDDYRMRIITYAKEYTDVWFPGHAYFCQWLTANCERDTKTYYVSWEERKPAVLERGIKGISIGFGESYYHSHVTEPLTFDFSKPMPAPR